jgi:hypothetical protein
VPRHEGGGRGEEKADTGGTQKERAPRYKGDLLYPCCRIWALPCPSEVLNHYGDAGEPLRHRTRVTDPSAGRGSRNNGKWKAAIVAVSGKASVTIPGAYVSGYKELR